MDAIRRVLYIIAAIVALVGAVGGIPFELTVMGWLGFVALAKAV